MSTRASHDSSMRGAMVSSVCVPIEQHTIGGRDGNTHVASSLIPALAAEGGEAAGEALANTAFAGGDAEGDSGSTVLGGSVSMLALVPGLALGWTSTSAPTGIGWSGSTSVDGSPSGTATVGATGDASAGDASAESSPFALLRSVRAVRGLFLVDEKPPPGRSAAACPKSPPPHFSSWVFLLLEFANARSQ
eukprot:m.165118 g.165118  ORF g.165118 m.165118 type:complete len:191 (-) comp14666_c0_seq5:2099-2671(-)